ncbi:hypothetical protein HD806DRAFT_545752 [Xylariaceae sp. AK1471]|nr:hypothetical protein HD806DRAFT_545752 [Xylariaceae sp. AK1471]
MFHFDLASGGDNGGPESSKAKGKLRPRRTALDKGRQPPRNSSVDSDDEGVDTCQDADDDFRPQRKRRKSPPIASTRRQHRPGDVLSGKCSGQHNIPILKRATEGGRTTFQLQFTRGSCAIHGLEDDATHQEYYVERILDHKFTGCNGQELEVLVKWEGGPEPAWEPAKELENREAYDTYVAHNHISKPLSRRKRGRPMKYMTGNAVSGG